MSFKVKNGNIEIVVSPIAGPPMNVDAVVKEEDTCLVLSAPRKIQIPKKSTAQIVRDIYESIPETPGSVLVRSGCPIHFLAVIYDFNEEPSFREEWITSVLVEIFKECGDRNIQAIGMPLLGTLYGNLQTKRFIEILMSAITKHSYDLSLQLWLMSPNENLIESLLSTD